MNTNRNPYHRALSSKIFKKKVVRAKKGRGSYSRKGNPLK